MEIRNLTPQEGIEVQGLLAQMQEMNPLLEWKTYPMGEQPPSDGSGPAVEERLARLQGSVDELSRKFELVFGGHILMGGKFIKF
jgi:hypothetical protein